MVTGRLSDRAPSANWISIWSRARSRPWSCSARWWRTASGSGMVGRCRMGVRSKPEAFQWSTASVTSSISTCPTASSILRKPSSASISRTSSAMNSKKLTTKVGLARELLAQLGVLGGHPHRAGVEVAHPHHHTAHHHQRRGGEAELLGPQQRSDHHVAAGLELAVDLHHDAVAQIVEEQRLLGLGQPQLPGRAGVLDGRQRRGPRAAVVAGDEHHVGVGLGHPGGHRAHPHLGHQLHVDAGRGVGVLEVVDQLGQVLDGVDVVVGRRGDEPHPGRGVAGLGDPRVHLVARQLAALAGLGPLGHLDLDVVRVDQVLAGHPEAPRRGLLDRAAPQVAVGISGCSGRRPRRPRRCWTCPRCGSWRWPGSRGPPWRSIRSSWRRWRSA